MTDRHDKAHKQRREVLKQARRLACSGQYADAASVQAAMHELDGVEAVQGWFDDWSFRAQLNLLCKQASGEKLVANPRSLYEAA